MKSWLRQATMLGVVAAIFAVGATAAAQDGGKKYNNPFITDGTVDESPLKMDYDVTEVRGTFNEYNQRIIEHYVTGDYDTLVNSLKQRYKTGKPLSDGIKIIGFVFLTQKQHWSFTLEESSAKVQYVMEVAPGATPNTTVFILHAMRYGMKNAAFKRSWFGSSPVKLEEYKIPCKAY